VRDYLWSIQDPALVALKDAIRRESADMSLATIQQQFVDVIEGGRSNAMAQTVARSREVKVVRQKRKERSQPASRSKRNKAAPPRMFSEKLTLDEAEALKVANPDDWFLTNKTIPPAYFKKLNRNEQRRLAEFRGKDARAVKTLRTTKRTAAVAEEPVEIPDGKPAAIVATTDAPVETIVPAKPTAQFGRGAHQSTGVAKED
jgi:hypothetical protein